MRGNDPDDLADVVYEITQQIPKMVLERPVLYPHLGLVWLIFQSVLHSRRVGFGPFFIPLSEMIAALDLFEIHDVEQRLYYVQLLQQLDRVYLEWQERNRPKK